MIDSKNRNLIYWTTLLSPLYIYKNKGYMDRACWINAYAVKCKSVYKLSSCMESLHVLYIGASQSTVHWRDSSPSRRHLYCVYIYLLVGRRSLDVDPGKRDRVSDVDMRERNLFIRLSLAHSRKTGDRTHAALYRASSSTERASKLIGNVEGRWLLLLVSSIQCPAERKESLRGVKEKNETSN